AVGVGNHSGKVDLVNRRMHPELTPHAHRVRHLGSVQHCFGGNTTAMQAGTADLVLLHQCDVEAQLSCPQSAGIAAAAGTEHDQIERSSHAAILSALVKAAIPCRYRP